MIKNKNNIKDIKFHKVSLKNVKRIETSSQDIPNLKNYLINRDNKNSFKTSAKDIILKTLEDKYSIINGNKNLIIRPRRIKSTKKNMVFKVKDLILNQKSKRNKEEEKNVEENEINNNFYLKSTTRNEIEKKDAVSGIKRCKTSCNTKSNKNKIINNNKGKKQLTNNNIIKNKKTKKAKKYETNNNKNIKSEQSEGFVNKKDFKFLCCL